VSAYQSDLGYTWIWNVLQVILAFCELLVSNGDSLVYSDCAVGVVPVSVVGPSQVDEIDEHVPYNLRNSRNEVDGFVQRMCKPEAVFIPETLFFSEQRGM
jgi:hypothetical protein